MSKKKLPVIHEVEPGKFVGVVKGESIRLYGVDRNRYVRCPETGKRVPGEVRFDVTFRIGDEAEYSSYNLKYIGTIVSIGDKTVTVDPGRGEKKTRMKFENFLRRNCFETVAQKRAYNSEEMMYL